MEKVKTTFYIFIIAFTFIMIFQGSRGLWERDEGRYTDIALCMLQTKDFIVPRLNKDTVHFSKPPLTYWAIAGGIALLGKNEWGARLANGLSFALTVVLIFLIGTKIYPKNSILPPIIYGTSIFPFIAANFVTTDTILTLWETLAVYGFVHWWSNTQKDNSSTGLIIMWTGFGLAFLTKGPPGLLPLFAILIFIALSGQKQIIPKLFNIIGISIFFMIGFMWYIIVVLKYKNLLSYFLINEFIKRIATGTHHRNPQWYKPFIIYLPILIFGIVPWTSFLLKNFKPSQYKIWKIKWWQEKITKDPWEGFLLLWILLPLLIFFIAKSRLPLYILPLFVPLCLFISTYINIKLNSKKTKSWIIIWILFLFGLKFIGSKIPYKKDCRLFAHQIKELSYPLPQEVAFIDCVPFWGLNLYFNCEVKDLTINKNKMLKHSETNLLKEIKEKKSILYVAKNKKISAILALLKKKHFYLQKIGKYKSWIFFKIKNKVT